MIPTHRRETTSYVVQRQDGVAGIWRDSKSFPENEDARRFRDSLDGNHPGHPTRVILRVTTLTITEQPL